MKKYIIDANLPYYFSLWQDDIYEHVIDINPHMKDSEIWQYAKKHNLTIIWSNILAMSEEYKLVRVYKDRIKGID